MDPLLSMPEKNFRCQQSQSSPGSKHIDDNRSVIALIISANTRFNGLHSWKALILISNLSKAFIARLPRRYDSMDYTLPGVFRDAITWKAITRHRSSLER